jgi:hypothetical protein
MRYSENDYGFSFQPCEERRAIFVHIPKCAGVSVTKALFGRRVAGHTTLQKYLYIFEPSQIDSFYKFTFVRNPWDRLVSAYSFLKSGGLGEQDKEWFVQELSEYSDFDEFVRGWLNRENIWKWHHFRPQYHYMLESRGKVSLDFVGFFENITDDFRCVSSKMGVSAELGASNQSSHKHYTEYYNDETRDIVSNVYSEDIRMLGYEFDNSNVEALIAQRDSGKKYRV